jgi:Tfp pilus assembly protein PilP
MTLMKTLLMVIVASACAFAQNPVASTKTAVKSAPESKKAAVQKAQPAPAPKPSAASKPAAKAVANPAKTPAAATAVVKPAATPAASAKAPTKAAQVASKGPQRDPFVSPIVQKVTSSVSCTGGKKCLEPTQVILKGVVSSDNGRIAVVTNPANKAYFLREQDPVLNGYVIRITGDSIVFRENVTDRLGKVSQREVVKKVSAPAV